MTTVLCRDRDWLLSQEAFSIYASCMYRPAYADYRARMEGFVSDPSVQVFVCGDRGGKTGMLVLDRSGPDAEIIGIAVSAGCRRQGIGKRMIRQVMDLERLERITAETDADSVGFYRRCGFSAEKETVPYPDGTGIRYRCELSRNAAKLTVYRPEYEDLWFRQQMLSDEETMSYNHAWGGTIPFPREAWQEWYNHWVISPEGKRYYRYLRDGSDRFVGEIAYHYDSEISGFIADVIVHSKYRGNGYGSMALDLLCSAAKENGITELYDDIAADNPAAGMFIRHGFREKCRTEEKIILKKDL